MARNRISLSLRLTLTSVSLQRLGVPVNGHPEEFLLFALRCVAAAVVHGDVRQVVPGYSVEPERRGRYRRVLVVLQIEVEIDHVVVLPRFLVGVLWYVTCNWSQIYHGTRCYDANAHTLIRTVTTTIGMCCNLPRNMTGDVRDVFRT